MKKYIIGGILVIAVVGYIIFVKESTATPAETTTTTETTPTSTADASAGNTPAASAGRYKDGTYTGTVADAFYGNLQAVVTVSGGKITDVTFPQYPTSGHSGEVSNEALPVLKQEAIATQSADVNVVSGATQDSQAFQQSLASALAQAKS